jgi:hypothetical protein
MKKYLINGLLALVAGGFAASCADHDVDYVPIAQQKTQAYEQAFKELIGGEVDPNQDWGFTGTPISELEEEDSPARSMTRASGDGYYSIGDYEYFTIDKIKEIITNKFPERVNAGSQLNDYEFLSNGDFTFSFVYAITSGLDEIGYYYYNPSNGINSRTERVLIDNIQTFITNNQLFQYGVAGSGCWQTPTVNPDSGDGNACSDLINKNLNCGTVNEVRGKMITLRVPAGYRFGFYIRQSAWDATTGIQGLKLYSNKSLNYDGNFYSAVATLSDGTYAVGLEDWIAQTGGDFDCNDIVMAIKPSKNKPTIINLDSSTSSESKQHVKQRRMLAQGRVFCEDLGTAGRRDIDFNDIVFDARIWGNREYDEEIDANGTLTRRNETLWTYSADICMLAGGGTIPAKLLINDFSENYVHELFNSSIGMTTMVNTVDEHAKLTVTWDNMSTNPGATQYLNKDITEIIRSLYAEDPSHTVKVKDIPISVLWQSAEDATKLGSNMQSVGLLQANLGQVPHKICLPILTKWPSERIPMDGAYPQFREWAKNKDSHPTFWDTYNADSLYVAEGSNASLPLIDPYGIPYALNDTDLNKDYFTYGPKEVTTTTIDETIVWQGNEYMGEWSESNHAIGLYNGASLFAGMDEEYERKGFTYTIRIYGTTTGTPGEGAKEGPWGAKLFAGQWTAFEDLGATSHYEDFASKGYIEYRPIGGDLISHLKNDTGYGNSAVMQGRNFTATKISYVKTTVTKRTE